MSKKTAEKAKKAVEEKLKDTEDRLDAFLRKLSKLREQYPAPAEQTASHP